ncbi:MAG: hypothetical protein LZF62_170031 [Nitrospira sp.]|nr:MAG: hypothetical protein LZF62_170031 [Nitrospira sp.]
MRSYTPTCPAIIRAHEYLPDASLNKGAL